MSLLAFPTNNSLPAYNVDRLWNEFFEGCPVVKDLNLVRGKNRPYCEFSETDTQHIIDVHLPGFNKSHVSLELNNGVISFTATKDTENSSSTYSRSWSVDNGITENDVSADMKDGILTITVNKKSDSSRKSITIN